MKKLLLCIATLVVIPQIPAQAAPLNITTTQCNGSVLCATRIDNLLFQGTEYNIKFLPINFYEEYPNGNDWQFWGDPTKAQAAANTLVQTLRDSGVSGVTNAIPSGMLSSSNGFSIPYQYYNSNVVYSITGASNAVDPATWAVWSPGTASLFGLYVPVFSAVSSVPEPSAAYLALCGVILIAISGRIFRDSR